MSTQIPSHRRKLKHALLMELMLWPCVVLPSKWLEEGSQGIPGREKLATRSIWTSLDLVGEKGKVSSKHEVWVL